MRFKQQTIKYKSCYPEMCKQFICVQCNTVQGNGSAVVLLYKAKKRFVSSGEHLFCIQNPNVKIITVLLSLFVMESHFDRIRNTSKQMQMGMNYSS